MCVWEVRWPTSQSGFDFAHVECIVCSYKLQFCQVYTSISPDGSISAVSHTKADWAVWLWSCGLWTGVSVWGETQGKCVCLTAFSEMLEILLWLCGSESFQLRNVTYILCPPSPPPLIVCECGKHTHAYRSNALGFWKLFCTTSQHYCLLLLLYVVLTVAMPLLTAKHYLETSQTCKHI